MSPSISSSSTNVIAASPTCEAGARLLRCVSHWSTATPDNERAGSLGNIVAEYNYEQSVADGVNVSYDCRNRNRSHQERSEVKAKDWVDHRDRQTARSAG